MRTLLKGETLETRVDLFQEGKWFLRNCSTQRNGCLSKTQLFHHKNAFWHSEDIYSASWQDKCTYLRSVPDITILTYWFSFPCFYNSPQHTLPLTFFLSLFNVFLSDIVFLLFLWIAILSYFSIIMKFHWCLFFNHHSTMTFLLSFITWVIKSYVVLCSIWSKCKFLNCSFQSRFAKNIWRWSI